jgi:cbb3-type cytochrome oxidase cytochrome c subunit
MELKELSKQINRLLATAIIALIIVVAMGLVLVSCREQTKTTEMTQPTLSQEELIKRGAYIVNASGCHDCHSPKVMTSSGPEPDPERLLSGYRGQYALAKDPKRSLKGLGFI